MSDNTKLNEKLWEEKNLIEPKKNCESKNEIVTSDTMNDIPSNAENLHWKDITDPKLRKKIQQKEWRRTNKEKLQLKKKIYYQNNKFKISKVQKLYRKNNIDKIKITKKTYALNNKEKILLKKKQYRLTNKEKYNEYRRNRLKTNPAFKLSIILRSRLRMALNKQYKSGSAVRDLGCSIEELKVYLENKFQPGMTWNNHGEWHIDHIKPLATFDLTDRKQLLEACHYTNLQPLWAKDNLSKNRLYYTR